MRFAGIKLPFSVVLITLLPASVLVKLKNTEFRSYLHDTISMNFWNRAKVEVDKNNTTFRWIAEKLGIPETTISGWRRQDVLPRADIAVEIAKLFGVSVEYLVTGTESGSPELREREREILNLMHELADDDLEVLLCTVKALAKRKHVDLSTQTAG